MLICPDAVISPEEILKRANKNDEVCQNLINKYIECFAVLSSESALSYNCHGGIFLVGSFMRGLDHFIKDEDFAKAGASWISFHPEASKHVDRSLSLIKEHNCKAGLALNPATPISCLEHVIEKIDFVLLMTVNPGFGGQKFIKGMLQKIKECKELISSTSNEVQIEVDGGIDLKNIKEVSEAGANIFVSGSTIFNSSDYSSTIKEMKSLVS